ADFLFFVDSCRLLLKVRVVVVLMYRNNCPAYIHEGDLTLAGKPYEPWVPSIPANQKRRHFSPVQITREAKVICPTRPIQFPRPQGTRFQLSIPLRLIEVP